ncbi:TetR/AcrR family transcriptional regulator [Roseixanthobacter glucoisosaccharinicivorans]|uniref:TetR/AcrR family transcriptional regulator n=1 Tax=Roseixanthobacter glucoisosaccharinicivorans TaxID=3119923 RepID=UPI00372681D3
MAARGRPRAFDRDAALNAAMELFWRKGFCATSVADLCAAMGINAPSLYAAFGSKEALYEAALHHYGQAATPHIWGRFAAAPTARDSIAVLLMASAANLPGTDHPAGCMVTLSTAGQEGGARLAALVMQARAEGGAMIAERLRRARAEGELPPGTDVAAVAAFYACVQHGMSIEARDGADREKLEAIARCALAAWPALTDAGAHPPAEQACTPLDPRGT